MKSCRIESGPSGFIYLFCCSYSSAWLSQSYDEFLMVCEWLKGLNTNYFLWYKYGVSSELHWYGTLIFVQIYPYCTHIGILQARFFFKVIWYMNMYGLSMVLVRQSVRF